MKQEDKKPKVIKVTLYRDLYFGSQDNPKSLDKIISELQKVWEDNRSTHDNIHIETDINTDEWDHPTSISMDIVGYRMENRSELLDRIAKEEQRQANIKEQMRREYENLKLIFEVIGIDKHFEDR